MLLAQICNKYLLDALLPQKLRAKICKKSCCLKTEMAGKLWWPKKMAAETEAHKLHMPCMSRQLTAHGLLLSMDCAWGYFKAPSGLCEIERIMSLLNIQYTLPSSLIFVIHILVANISSNCINVMMTMHEHLSLDSPLGTCPNCFRICCNDYAKVFLPIYGHHRTLDEVTSIIPLIHKR